MILLLMLTKYSPLLILISLCGPRPAAAETLRDAMAFAYTNNPTLLSERAHLQATDELVPQALANWRPSVSLSGNATRANLNENLGVAGKTLFVFNNETYGVTITQALYRGGQTVAQTEQAEAQVEAERAQLQIIEQQILLNAATAYMNFMQAEAVLRLSISDEQVLQKQLDTTQGRFHVGEVTRTDVAESQSRLLLSHAARKQAEGALRTASATYLQTIGHAPERTEAPETPIGLPNSLDQAEADATTDSPAIRLAEYNYRAALHGIDLVAGALQPTVSVSGSAMRLNNFDGPSTLENAAQIMLNVTVPLYQQGQEYSKLRAQKDTAGQFRTSLDQARLDVAQATAAAWAALQAGQEEHVSFTDQIAAAKIALNGVQKESQVGSRTVVEVLNAEQELLAAEISQVQAQHDEIVAAYQLLNAVGKLTAGALGLPVDVYDPTEHYQEVRDKWAGFGKIPEDAELRR
jgi:outer membrane protein